MYYWAFGLFGNLYWAYQICYVTDDDCDCALTGLLVMGGC